MKRKLLLSSAVIPALLATCAMGQVVNFHDDNNNQLSFPGVGYDELFTGQGAYSDPGNEIWNGFGQEAGYGSTYFYSGGPGGNPPWPQEFGNPGNPYAAYNPGSGWVTSTGTSLFNFSTGKLTNSGCATSSGQFTPITLSVSNYLGDNGIASLGAFAVPNGSPSFLLGECAYNNGTKPDEVFVLQHVPPGTYGLYLYGANFDNNRGTSFKVNSGSAHNGIAATLNNGVATPANAFVEGQNFVIFQDVTPDSDGHITITASPNQQDGAGNANLAGETDVNGFQLIFSPPPTAVGYTAAQNVLVGGTANFSFSPAFAASPSFQWQSVIGGITNNLADGGNVSGATTTNLTIADVGLANVGLYQCVISTATATNTSPAAPLTILKSSVSGPLQAGDSTSIVANVLRPGDALTDVNSNTTAPYNSIPPPFDMNVKNVEDNTLFQYVNFGANGSTAPFIGPVGFIVTPQIGATVLTGLRIFTAGSHPEADPSDYLVQGSDDGTNFTNIAGGLFGLPAQRNAGGGAVNITNEVLKEIDFSNTIAYSTYQVTFTNVNDDTTDSNGLQFAEIQLLGSFPPVAPGIVQQPTAAEELLTGTTLEASVVASEAGPLTYKWYHNTTTLISGATNAVLSIPNVQTADSGSYNCVISNPYGSTNSAALILSVVAPTPYEAAVLGDQALAYYPLDESGGTNAFEYIGGLNGTYDTNALVGQAGIPDPPFLGFPTNDLAVEVQGTVAGSWVSAPFGTLAGTNDLTVSNLTLTCWIYPIGTQNQYAGLIVNRSGAQGGLDIYPSGAATAGMLGYVWNNNNADTYSFVSGLVPPQNEWSLVALTIAPNQAVLYLLNASGRQSATNSIPQTEGLLGNAWRIGNDADGDPTRSFNGMINGVAVFTNTLSPVQINTLYDIGAFATTNVAPAVDVPTTAIAVDENGNGSISAAVVDGPPPFTFQWYYVVGATTNLITGATNGTLTLNDVQTVQSSYNYYVVVSNAYGATTSSVATLDILSGAPTVVTDVFPLLTVVPAGAPVTFSVAVTGTEPFSYQWSNGVAAISGATNTIYTFNALPGTNSYTVGIGNVDGITPSSTAVVVGLTNPPPVITFSGDGAGWYTNDGAGITPFFTNNVLELTDGSGGEATSAFFITPQYMGGFIASYVYQPSGSGTRADGTTFCVQNAPATTNAVGAGGGDLGFYGITNSAGFELNLYVFANGGSGIQFGTNGETPDAAIATPPYVSPGEIDIDGGNPIYVQIYYSEGVYNVFLEDEKTLATFTTNYVADLQSIVHGSSAYIGFTGGDGGSASVQTVSNFVFSYTTPPILSVAHGTGGSVTISWPVSVSGLFILQEATALNGAWSNVLTPPVIANSKYEVTLTPGTTAFYRLVIP